MGGVKRKTPPRNLLSSDAASKISTSGNKLKPNAYFYLWTAFIAVVVAIIAQYLYYNYYYLPKRISMKAELPPISIQMNEKIWGTYRSHLYFGLRALHKDSPLFGMMWYQQPEIEGSLPNVHHRCEQDDVARYGWTLADGRSFGKQTIKDGLMDIYTDWVNNGSSWTARITTKSNAKVDYAFIYYFVLQDDVSKIRANYKNGEFDHFTGTTSVLGNFRFSFDSSVNINSLSFAALKMKSLPDVSLIKEILLSSTMIDRQRHQFRLPSGLLQNGIESEPNVLLLQLNVKSNSTTEISFIADGEEAIKGQRFFKLLEERMNKFEKNFEATYGLTAKGYPDIYQELGNVALSNMLGSIGYAYGYNRVQSTYSNTASLYGPHALLSSCPSRPVFPRGFLWDEGFHHLLFKKFDPGLSLQIMAYWLNTMNIDGWIPREMILDKESESRVPNEYITQRDNIANPPMFFYVIEKYLDDKEHSQNYKQVILSFYPRLRLWYTWLNKTQAGKKPGTYRWRGRNETTDLELNPKTLPSGLDDYPRASHPSDDEYHVDLRCWMALSARVLSKLARLGDDTVNEALYESDANYLLNTDLLNRLHWSEKKQCYSDYGLHSTAVQLQRVEEQKSKNGDRALGIENIPMKRIVKSEPRMGLVEDAFGYVSLFPVLLRLLPHDSDKLGIILNNIKSEKELWSNFGLRSLSPSSIYYNAHNTEHDPPYWRGAIWINMNYMMLSALKHYSSIPGPNRDTAFNLYSELRNNLVSNVAKEFRRTGFLWENYNDNVGTGQGAHPFTGWSSLVLSVMAEQYD